MTAYFFEIDESIEKKQKVFYMARNSLSFRQKLKETPPPKFKSTKNKESSHQDSQEKFYEDQKNR